MNVRARKGVWQAFGLRDGESVVGWFCCHDSLVDRAEAECRRILAVSGSPYEEDSGSSRNCDETRAAGVLVINRYDWSWTDRRGLVVGEEATAGIGLADYAAATTVGKTSDDWTASGDGVMLECDGEYEFGRFGYHPDGCDGQLQQQPEQEQHCGQANSFLYFRATTTFTQTRLGPPPREPLLELLTDDERYARRLAGGVTFLGFDFFKKILNKHTMQPEPIPPPRWAGQLLGPFSTVNEVCEEPTRIFEDSDLEALQLAVGGPVKSWFARLYHNRMLKVNTPSFRFLSLSPVHACSHLPSILPCFCEIVSMTVVPVPVPCPCPCLCPCLILCLCDRVPTVLRVCVLRFS
jgi:hypothetical protein